MTQLQEKSAAPLVGGTHKRPFFAFVLVALICGLVFGNALRSEAFRSVLRTAVDNIVSSSSLVHERAGGSTSHQPRTLALTRTAAIPGQTLVPTSPTRPGLAKGHDKGKAQGEAKGHHKAHPGLAKGHHQAQPGLAQGHDKGKAQGEAKGHHKTRGSADRSTGRARAAQGGLAKGQDRAADTRRDDRGRAQGPNR